MNCYSYHAHVVLLVCIFLNFYSFIVVYFLLLYVACVGDAIQIYLD